MNNRSNESTNLFLTNRLYSCVFKVELLSAISQGFHNFLSYLIDMSDVSNAKGDGVNIKLVIIKGQLLCISHHP